MIDNRSACLGHLSGDEMLFCLLDDGLIGEFGAEVLGLVPNPRNQTGDNQKQGEKDRRDRAIHVSVLVFNESLLGGLASGIQIPVRPI